MPRTANLEGRENVCLSLDKRARDQLAALVRTGETTASAVVREAVKRMYQIEIGGKKMKTYRYEEIHPLRLTATDLQGERESASSDPLCYCIMVYDEDDCLMPERAQALYFPTEGRLGIAWGADATWADVKDVESGIEMWLNDPEAWEAAN